MKIEKQSIYRLTVTAVLIALGTVLSLVKVWEMPLGGTITLVSMLPVCLISILYGTKYAILPSFIYALGQMLLGNPFSWGLTPTILIGCILFDYIVAFTVLCVAGAFRKKGTFGIIAGVALACVLRFVSHFISGFVLFANLEQFKLFGAVFKNHPMLYSAAYNGFYMVPELVLTVIATFLLVKSGALKQITKLIKRQ